MLLPSSFALVGNVSSHTVKQYSEIAGMFERRGNIFAPAGIIWSVVILSPTLSETSAFISSARGTFTGKGFMFGPLRTSTFGASSGEAGGTTILSFIRNFSGIT